MPSSSQNPQNPKKPKASALKPAVPKEAAKALASIESKLQKLSAADLLPINIDIPRAVSIAIAALPHLALFREKASKLPDFDISQIDQMGTYALAAWYAYLLALPEVSTSALAKLLDEAKPLREHMLLAAELLAHAGFFDKAAVEAIRSGQGNLDTANDLVALSALYASAWPDVEQRSTILWPDVQRASQLGPQILIALGERTQPSLPELSKMDASDRKKRAFTLFVKAYDQCRRAASYLRWNEGDAEELVPSLYGGRNMNKRAQDDAQSPEESPSGGEEA